MQPAPHALFPIGHEGGPQRLLSEAVGKETIEVDVGLRICQSCGKRWFLPKCSCGGHTTPRNGPTRQRIPVADVLRQALNHLGELKAPEIKAVQGMISRNKTPEPLEKGVLRAKHGIFVFKDGTTRYDMTNLPLTHFTPKESGISVEAAKHLGYAKDIHGQPLEREDQILELRPQDILIAESCGAYLVHVAEFVDDLLEKLYGLPRFYNASRREDLLGQLVVTLAPHTSGGVLARIIGFTRTQTCYAHPYLIAARRRNCDGDEDSVILLMDSLLNFSRSFLPDKRGGLMDAPLVLTAFIDPNEIDKEAHNLDVMTAYPLALYEAAARFAPPKEVEPLIDTVGKRVGSVLQYEGFAFTHGTLDIAAGPVASAYGEGSMVEKVDQQLALALRIRAVDPDDVVARIVVHHFLPDLIGNLKAFSSQQVRCTKCGEKYRRIPLRAKCLACGGNLTLTVHESSVKKYLEISKRISSQFKVSQYLRQRIDLIEEAITSLFTSDKAQDLKLDDFF
jgi:DNA polymerase II large subunit